MILQLQLCLLRGNSLAANDEMSYEDRYDCKIRRDCARVRED